MEWDLPRQEMILVWWNRVSISLKFKTVLLILIYLQNNIFSTYRYTIGMFKKGYSKTLEVDDLYNPTTADRSEHLGDRLEE